MTCRHSPGDTSCSSHPYNVEARARESERQRAEEARKKREKEAQEVYARTPDKERYEIVQFERVGHHVVMKVLYPNCAKCSYEGNKVMVFLNVSEVDLLKWKVIDPHFRDPKAPLNPREAPGPAARFPASKEGWDDAIEYAKRKSAQGR